jgi:hypothetical protein
MKDSTVLVRTFWDGDASSVEKSWMRLFWRIVRWGRAGRNRKVRRIRNRVSMEIERGFHHFLVQDNHSGGSLEESECLRMVNPTFSHKGHFAPETF